MKKVTSFKLVAILLTLVSYSGLNAQDDENYNAQGRFGVRGGVTIAKQTYDGGNLDVDPKSKFGADLAAIFNIPIGSGFFMLQPEVHWMQKGSVIEDISGSGDDITSTLNYLEIPVLLRFNFGGELKLFAIGGPSLGFYLGGKSDGNSIPKDTYEDTEWGAHIGLGIGFGALEVDVRYMAGLSDINAASGNVDDIKNSAFGAGVTLKF